MWSATRQCRLAILASTHYGGKVQRLGCSRSTKLMNAARNSCISRSLSAQYYHKSNAAAQTTTAASTAPLSPVDIGAMTERRMNKLGVQMLTPTLWTQLFGREGRLAEELGAEELEIAKAHLQQQGIWGKLGEPVEDTPFSLPSLHGKNIEEHISNIGSQMAQPYLQMAKTFAENIKIPDRPDRWLFNSGWTRYTPDGRAEPVPWPTENVLVFDVETLPRESPHAVLACAASSKAWYGWLSPWLTNESTSSEHLIPMGGGPDKKERVIIGHHVGYDRARVLDDYNLQASNIGYIDTLSLHVAVSGLCTRQRSGWLKFSKAVDQGDYEYLKEHHESMKYFDVSSVNSLREVARFHCQIELKKELRDIFTEGALYDVQSNFQHLMHYCALDVKATHGIYCVVFPKFLKKCPHPVAFFGMLQMGSSFLTVNEGWPQYIARSECTYQQRSKRVESKLRELAQTALEEANPLLDPWLRQLDWKKAELRMTKPKYLKNGNYAKNGEPRPVARQFMPGYPQWYRDLCDRTTKLPKLSTRARIAPLLLKLKWNGFPLYYSQLHGWTFRVPRDADFTTKSKPLNFPRKPLEDGVANPSLETSDLVDLLPSDQDPEDIELLNAEYEPIPAEDLDGIYYRIPHKDGDAARCGNPLAKNYISAFEDGILTSEYPLAREALAMNASCSYWISARERVRSQFVVWDDTTDATAIKSNVEHLTAKLGYASVAKFDTEDSSSIGLDEKILTVPQVRPTAGVHLGVPSRGPGTGNGMILPQINTMGTITRRAVEPTWMTASNAKKNRIGSELKSTIRAPPGYRIIGADVDSEELWISSLIGDAQFGAHGATAFGWMTLQGTKSAGTDMHSKTASILGINRDHAKIFNYGRIYGAGIKFATQLLMQFNPNMDEETAQRRSWDLYAATKGNKWHSDTPFNRGFWFGGSESYVFNALESIATSDAPKTPVLGCSITDALTPEYTERQFMTSRVNWVVQSSGVDYLHLLITSMAYLIRRYKINARFMLSVHDEIRYLVKEEDQYRAALALQISNLWTRALFSYKLNINDLPQSVAFFSCVDIDHVLRKEVDMDCVTPSNPDPIAPGEKITINELLKLTNGKIEPDGMATESALKDVINHIPQSKHRSTSMQKRDQNKQLTYLKAQQCETKPMVVKCLQKAGLLKNNSETSRGNTSRTTRTARALVTAAATKSTANYKYSKSNSTEEDTTILSSDDVPKLSRSRFATQNSRKYKNRLVSLGDRIPDI
ncbi:DNA polymerase family A-domain-containing protein [Syncephalis fuscata]|nr:DNA polymerase family A-domain-containing protein [Syncephalis fuscata]